MPLVTFQPSSRSVQVAAGTDLVAAARQAGVLIESPCGGEGTCGKCLVRVVSGEVEFADTGLLAPSALAEGYVLACRSKLLTEPVTVDVAPHVRGGGKFTSASDDMRLIRRELFPHDGQYNPLALKWRVAVPEPELEDGLSDLDRLTMTLQKEWGPQTFIFSLPVIQTVADALRAEGGLVTATLIRGQRGTIHVARVEPGDQTARHYGIAVDVGTTTVAVQLVFLQTAKVLATHVDYNDQIQCGLDVISRINYARRPERLRELRRCVLATINRLTREAALGQAIAPEEICNAVISGNTTMVHLLLGMNPEYIRLEPYTPTLLKVPYLTAGEVGIEINPQSWVHISPCVGSYVGGDITAGLLCTDLAAGTDDLCLFIDIGTNGELVVGNRDFLMTCACSAGPAFEGGGIHAGMRAAEGAIEDVEVDPETGLPRWRTIGGGAPRGICGSGMISLLASLLTTGWIDSAGKFNRDRPCEAIRVQGRQAHYELVPAESSHDGHPILISELEIDNILRAKAAIYSACALMLHQLDLEFADLAKVYIAGGFGRFLDLEKAVTIGLLPDLPRERFHYIGNASLIGSVMVLVSRENEELQYEMARRMTYIELSTDPGYMDQYTGALFLPHTDMDQFPSVRALLARH